MTKQKMNEASFFLLIIKKKVIVNSKLISQLSGLCFISKFNSLESPAKTQRRQENRVVSILLEILCVLAEKELSQ